MKLSVLSCIAIYPQVQVFGWFVAWTAPGLPGLVQALVVTALISVATTYAVMPWLTGALAGWLYPEDGAGQGAER